jgi:hypothetical protein
MIWTLRRHFVVHAHRLRELGPRSIAALTSVRPTANIRSAPA